MLRPREFELLRLLVSEIEADAFLELGVVKVFARPGHHAATQEFAEAEQVLRAKG